MTQARVEWYAGDNTHVIEVDGLRLRGSVTEITDATVTVTVMDADGVEIPDTDWPLSVPWNASRGLYTVAIPASDAIAAGDSVIVKVAAEKGGAKAEWQATVPVKARPFSK